MQSSRKRANKKQQELLVERLHNNRIIVRENQADAGVMEFQANVSSKLNQLGCSRTVEQWQHIWNVWVAKVKTKARKVRDSIRATGGGPTGADLNDTENKILDIIGSAFVDGFASLEMGIPLSTPLPMSPAPHQSMSPSLQPVLEEHPVETDGGTRAVPLQRASGRVTRRRRLPRTPRPPVRHNLVQALNENGRLLRESIVQAAEILAAAIRSSGIPVLVQNSQCT